MSLRAMLWALHDAPCADPIDKLILLVLADHAGDDGRHAFPAVSTIADTVPCDRATVHRHLRVLEQAGMIVRGDQADAAGLRSDRRPTVYDLPLPGRSVRPRPMLTGSRDNVVRGRSGVAPVRPEPENQETNQGRGVARGETADGAPLGCASHRDRRRPSCDTCARVLLPSKDQVRPSGPPPTEALKIALRGSR